MATIMQGDEYPLHFKLTADDEPLNLDDIEIVEIVIGNIKKDTPIIFTMIALQVISCLN